jgi:hypothetical protein
MPGERYRHPESKKPLSDQRLFYWQNYGKTTDDFISLYSSRGNDGI